MDEVTLFDSSQLVKIPGASTYSVSRVGDVWSHPNRKNKSFRKLKPSTNRDGYFTVRLKMDTGDFKTVAVHSMMARAFLPDRPSLLHQVRHINDIKSDLRVENLVWGTAAENAADRERNRRTAKGERCGLSKLTEDAVLQIRAFSRLGESMRMIGRRFNVSGTAIRAIVTRRTWKHVA